MDQIYVQIQQACHQARPQGRTMMFGSHGFRGALLNGVLVDQFGPDDERMVEIKVFHPEKISPL
jgi:hypothetical protein